MDLHRSREAKRQQIEHELVVDPARTNRHIARLVKCDHKTVAKARAAVGEIPQAGEFGKIPHGGEIGQAGEIGHQDDRGDISWGDVPDDAYTIPAQGLTSAFIEKDTGDLIILQDHWHLCSEDVVVRIGMLEVEQFVEGLVAMVRRRDQEP
jgi:hypothetical protein